MTLLTAFTVLTGLVYPLLVTGLAQLVFPAQAQGSLLRDGERAVGSALIGQTFTDPALFWSRPSVTAPLPYNGLASTGSNLGPTNPALAEAVRGRIEALRASGVEGPIPVDLVTASGSGLDPDISEAAARVQMARVASRRGVSVDAMARLVDRFVITQAWGPNRVNALALNLALVKEFPAR
jgi:potassium-transporting ATPase KdpC subunit